MLYLLIHSISSKSIYVFIYFIVYYHKYIHTLHIQHYLFLEMVDNVILDLINKTPKIVFFFLLQIKLTILKSSNWMGNLR